MADNSKLSFAFGVPTGPDVKSLRDAFKDLKEGDLVKYTDIEKTINSERGTHRFVSVTNAWRKELYRELNIVLDAEMNVGFVVANPSDRVHISSGKYKGGLRKIVKAGDIACKTRAEGLSQDELRAKDHIVSACAALRLAAATQAKQLKYPEMSK